MYKRDPASFLLEEARLDPPVTSTTALFSEDTNIAVSIGSEEVNLFFPKGSTHSVSKPGSSARPALAKRGAGNGRERLCMLSSPDNHVS